MLHNKIIRFAFMLCLIAVICVSMAACGSGKIIKFTMRSNDTVGATTHILVGGEYEPSGKYEVICVKGHGALTINDANLHMFAADGYIGEEYSGLTYVESIILELNANDIISARAFNSSELEIEFKYIDSE